MARRTLEPTLSVRLLWPFARAMGVNGGAQVAPMLKDLGIAGAHYGDPDFRLPHRVAMAALEMAIAATGDPKIGLAAGLGTDHGDFAALEYAARSSPTVGGAIRVMIRYMRVMNEYIEAAVSTDAERAYWRIRPKDGPPMPPAANDYIVAASVAFSRRNMETYTPATEIRLMHDRPSYADEYEPLLGIPVSFGADENVIVFRKAALDAPMLQANRGVAAAFELQVRRALERLEATDGLVGRIREGLPEDLRRGGPSMQRTARRLGMGVATLRRHLEEEGTTFSDIVDGVRSELAKRHLRDADPTVSEVAFLLGFSDVRAFGRAFRRWTGHSPTEFREAGPK